MIPYLAEGTDPNVITAWAAWIGAIATPLAGVAVATISLLRSKKSKKSIPASEAKQLDIKEQEADTHYWSALVESFNDSMETMRRDYDRLDARYAHLEEKYNQLDLRFNAKALFEQQMLAHIMDLENLVPDPPGPPRRPWL